MTDPAARVGAAQNVFVPHLSHRTAIYEFGAAAPPTEYIVVDLVRPDRDVFPSNGFAEFRAAVGTRRGAYRTVFDEQGVVVSAGVDGRTWSRPRTAPPGASTTPGGRQSTEASVVEQPPSTSSCEGCIAAQPVSACSGPCSTPRRFTLRTRAEAVLVASLHVLPDVELRDGSREPARRDRFPRAGLARR